MKEIVSSLVRAIWRKSAQTEKNGGRSAWRTFPVFLVNTDRDLNDTRFPSGYSDVAKDW